MSYDLDELLNRLRALIRVVDHQDPNGKLRSCIALGDADSGILLLAALRGRFASIADVSTEGHGLWQQSEMLSALLPDVRVTSVDADVFDDESLKVLSAAGRERFDFMYLHKTLHHLRTNDCKLAGVGDHECGGEACIGNFSPSAVLNRLWQFADKVILSEYHYLGEDCDKDSSRGGMLDTDEIRVLFRWLKQNALATVYRPFASPLRALSAKEAARQLLRTDYFLVSCARPAETGRSAGMGKRLNRSRKGSR